MTASTASLQLPATVCALAVSMYWKYCGRAMAARMPMIAITIMTSIRVKPSSGGRPKALSESAPNIVLSMFLTLPRGLWEIQSAVRKMHPRRRGVQSNLAVTHTAIHVDGGGSRSSTGANTRRGQSATNFCGQISRTATVVYRKRNRRIGSYCYICARTHCRSCRRGRKFCTPFDAGAVIIWQPN